MTSEIKGKNGQRPGTKAGFKPAEYINYSLTETDKSRFKAWYGAKGFDAWSLIDSLLNSDYSISIKPDGYSGGYAAYILPISEANVNHGFILSGRASSGTMAVLGVLFRHYVVFEADWPGETVRHNQLDDE